MRLKYPSKFGAYANKDDALCSIAGNGAVVLVAAVVVVSAVEEDASVVVTVVLGSAEEEDDDAAVVGASVDGATVLVTVLGLEDELIVVVGTSDVDDEAGDVTVHPHNSTFMQRLLKLYLAVITVHLIAKQHSNSIGDTH